MEAGDFADEEWKIMCQHPVYSYKLLYQIAYLRLALDTPYYYHEKWVESGYPKGRKGEQIPLFARIFAVVDACRMLCNQPP